MNALYYSAAGQFEVRKVEIPQVNDDQVLIKVALCGMCGTDMHIHEGEFIATFPLIPGHEFIGTIEKLGKDVQGFAVGDRVVADNGISCGHCFYCRRRESTLCENFQGLGANTAGAFAEYIAVHKKKVYKVHNLSDEAGTLIEPTACAVHGLDQLNLGAGSDVLIFGSGPTGLMLAQLLKLNGAVRLVLAAPAGPKLELAKKLEAADEYIALDRASSAAQLEELKKQNPYGFDAVVEATGNEAIANNSINFVRRGGKLMIYGVYPESARVHWPPGKIFLEEIQIIGSYASAYCFPRSVAYLDSGKLKTDGIITHVFGIDEYQKALDTMASRQSIKIAIRPTLTSKD
ncbi:hypothetical protein FRB90_003365 [Tulasnella sp. 427]|nr:hypothetical protein FRB90_003365 [Tulasnella sp. 427]